jgi:hypothetical protein
MPSAKAALDAASTIAVIIKAFFMPYSMLVTVDQQAAPRIVPADRSAVVVARAWRIADDADHIWASVTNMSQRTAADMRLVSRYLR